MAESKEAIIQNTMVYPMGLNICPGHTLQKYQGMKTTQVVTVEPKDGLQHDAGTARAALA